MWALLDIPKNFNYSILVNNVGTGNQKLLIDCNEEDIKRVTIVNCTSQVLMSQMMTEHFLKRSKSSAIITTSSMSV